MPPARPSRSSQRGNAIVETGLVFPIVFAFLFGVVQYSLVLFTYNTTTFGARAGARYAIVNGSTSSSPATAATVQNAVLASMPSVPTNSITVTTTWSPNNKPGSTVTVKVAVTVTPIIKYVMKNSLTFSSTSKMTILQ
ncbi:MAG TPA: TadE/TadG family type IV pilus assembly protein [Bryobacteraceae bacterium]|nr:TadE/TadG family type IV pilus assembly protein [Bryobacteraceae bacterium]